MFRTYLIGAAGLFLGVAAGCKDDGPTYTSLLPLDYASHYTKVRECRPSSDHNLNNVVVYADPTGAAPYMNRDAEFPTGCLIVKEEHGIDDKDCSGPVTSYTLMNKLAAGSSKSTLDWRWQRVNPADHTVVSQDAFRCTNCHADCGGPPYGYGGTCSAP